MSDATLTLRRVWLQVAMNIKLVLLTNQHIVHRGLQMLIPSEDKVDVITPTNILFTGGCEFWSLVEIKLMLLPQPTYCSEGAANFNVMMLMMWWWWWWWWRWCGDVMMMMMMMMMVIIIINNNIMTIVSVEQRPGWGEHVDNPPALSIYRSIYLSIYRSIYLTYLNVCLSI